MSTQAQPGIGAILKRWTTLVSAGAWDAISEVTALSYSGPTRNVIETFKLDNEDDYVNKIQGVLNAGNITATINFTRDEWFRLHQDLETRGTRQYQIELPNGEAIEFEGFVSEMPLDMGSDDVMKGDVVIEIDGPVAYVSSAA